MLSPKNFPSNDSAEILIRQEDLIAILNKVDDDIILNSICNDFLMESNEDLLQPRCLPDLIVKDDN